MLECASSCSLTVSYLAGVIMQDQHYGTMEVIRQCAVPGSMVKYNDRIYKVHANTRGKIAISNLREQFIVRDIFVEILLDRKGEPLIN
jgi:hypothetical protein